MKHQVYGRGAEVGPTGSARPNSRRTCAVEEQCDVAVAVVGLIPELLTLSGRPRGGFTTSLSAPPSLELVGVLLKEFVNRFANHVGN
jgi:hypothetical protein